MLLTILALQIILLLALLIFLLRKQSPTASPADPRNEALLTADLPAQLARVDSRAALLDEHLRKELASLRTDSRSETDNARRAAEESSAALRREVLGSIDTLGKTLREGLDTFRSDNRKDAEALRAAVDQQLKTLSDRFINFTSDATRQFSDSRTALDTRLTELGRGQVEQQEKLRGVVEQRLNALSELNEKKLEQMRVTVDEKLQSTLQDRLTESFGQVTDQLTKVHAGLGEMNTLSTGVQDLNRIFSNVKSRGGFAEVQLGKLLEQVLAPAQYKKNAQVKTGSQEVVEYAVRFPGSSGEEMLLPIDAKFPREDWERLESAYEKGLPSEIESARKAFDTAIRTEGKRICSKYINEPVTTPYAIMFLPTEGLYAEVLRRDGLQGELHQQCKVMVAGPSNLYALLTSFQLGFRMLNLQKKGNEVWKVLGEAKTEFTKFGGLLDKMEKKFGEVQNTFSDLNTRSRVINRRLRDVSEIDPDSAAVLPIDGILPMLAAEEED